MDTALFLVIAAVLVACTTCTSESGSGGYPSPNATPSSRHENGSRAWPTNGDTSGSGDETPGTQPAADTNESSINNTAAPSTEPSTSPLPGTANNGPGSPDPPTSEPTDSVHPGERTPYESGCHLWPRLIPVTREGCTGNIAVLECIGQCHSDSIPVVSLESADVTHFFHSSCKCCTMTTKEMHELNVEMFCNSTNSYRTVQVSAVTAYSCDCIPCDSL